MEQQLQKFNRTCASNELYFFNAYKNEKQQISKNKTIKRNSLAFSTERERALDYCFVTSAA